MPKNKDTRDFNYTLSRPAGFSLEKSCGLVSDTLPGDHKVDYERVNSFTGSPYDVKSSNVVGFKAMGQDLSDAALIGEALNHVDSITPAMGFTPGLKIEFVPDPFVKKTSSGTSIVNLQQSYRGIPVLFMERSIIFNSAGEVESAIGDSVELPSDVETYPSVLLEVAAKSAAEYMSSPSDEKDPWTGEQMTESEIDVSGYKPDILGRFSMPSQPAVLNKGPFGENVPAHLILFYQGETTRLGWHFVMSTPDMQQQYVIIVEADSKTPDKEKPVVIYAQKTSRHMAAKGRVWPHNPGKNPERALVDFPLGFSNYPVDSSSLGLPEGFPHDWVESGNSMAMGNYTIAVIGNTTDSISGSEIEGVLTFDDTDAEGDTQKVINIFYFCNYMHDFFYMLGFDEAHGNFQKINLTGIGTGGDPVLARAHPGPVAGTANMLTRADGVGAEMNMGLVSGPNRHTAFDSDVVFHEFTHGVTNRLVGGRLDARGLQAPQSGGMGEGWSDYFALTVQNCLALIQDEAAPEKTITGDWVVNRPQGIRRAPYDDNYPATYGKVGRSPYNEVHNIGEIWCAALMKMNRDFGTALEDKVNGHRVGWQIVVDGLKLTPSNPGFPDARDGILRALDDLKSSGRLADDEHSKVRSAAWKAFAHFGLGPNARSVGGSLSGVVEDKDPPADI